MAQLEHIFSILQPLLLQQPTIRSSLNSLQQISQIIKVSISIFDFILPLGATRRSFLVCKKNIHTSLKTSDANNYMYQVIHAFLKHDQLLFYNRFYGRYLDQLSALVQVQRVRCNLFPVYDVASNKFFHLLRNSGTIYHYLW